MNNIETLYNIIKNNSTYSTLYWIKETKQLYCYVDYRKYQYFFDAKTVTFSEFLDFAKDKLKNAKYEFDKRKCEAIMQIAINTDIFDKLADFECAILGQINPDNFEYQTDDAINMKKLMTL